MIQVFVDKFMARREALRKKFVKKHPESYEDIVKGVVLLLADEDEYGEAPDPERIHAINDGDYQGTLLFVIAANGYQPSDYWYVKVGYGSCSVCDTLKGIRNYEDDPPSAEQVEEYMTLALHIVQGIKKLGGSGYE